MDLKAFFASLDFNFDSDLKSTPIRFDKNETLTTKLNNCIFYYKSPSNINTSFYLITTSLEDSEVNLVRKHIWNKNDANLIFYSNQQDKINMLYAKCSPRVSTDKSILDSFSNSEIDSEKLEKIKKWQFNSGVFWSNYYKAIEKAKYKGIDKELVSALTALKQNLFETLVPLIHEEKKRNEVVQALIDRTLYIKYLEDNHIINSHFYNHYFNDATLTYEVLLENNSPTDLNKLYKKIHEIFHNNLFDQPTIDDEYLTKSVLTLISSSFKADLKTRQLKLYDFQFDVLPVEFISYIYEVFLSEKQKENGIYYTPKKLAQLIVDDVINEDRIGSILDPSSGSGMFLIIGYHRLLEIARKKGLEPEDSINKIKFRAKLLSDNIFGIEKELTAQRFTIFSLSLQIFEGINSSDIKEFIAKELRDKNKVELFADFTFFENIKHANTLNLSEKPFENKQFDYLLGNPPFFEIPNTEEYKIEISFLKLFKTNPFDNNLILSAKDLVGEYQISQCFFLKIKDWSNQRTRFGFVSNSSNFDNDYSERFQKYFYDTYSIETIYELSNVKSILFEKAKENILVLIFTNEGNKGLIDYYKVDLGVFSEKPFDLLIIQEDKAVKISQPKIIERKIRLRDFLIGNKFDFDLLKKLKEKKKLSEFILSDEDNIPFIYQGLIVVGKKAICKQFNISNEEWRKLNGLEKKKIFEQFKRNNISPSKNEEFLIRLIKPKDIIPFRIRVNETYLREDVSNFERGRNPKIFSGKKIILNRTGNRLNSVFSTGNIYFDFDLHSFKLKDDKLYNLINAILNSNLSNYYIEMVLRKRLLGSYPKIGNEDILNIPIPINFDQILVSKITKISKEITEGKIEYSEVENELNELIYDLYELSYWEKQRVRDYFLPKESIGKKQHKLDNYKNTIVDILNIYLNNPINKNAIEETPADFDLIIVKIPLNNSSELPTAEKAKKFTISEIFEHNTQGSFLASQEKIFGKDCVYIIKKDTNTNWTETKAFEDAQDILKHLIPNSNGERIH